MIRSPSYTGQFKRDVKRAEKRGKDMSKLRNVIESVLAGEPLPRELGDHPLKGAWQSSPAQDNVLRLTGNEIAG